MNIKKLAILLLIIVAATGCTSRKKLPFVPVDYPGYAWSSHQDGVIYGPAVEETEVRYDVNADGRLENVRVTAGKPELRFKAYLQKKMRDDWRFEENEPQMGRSLIVKHRQ